MTISEELKSKILLNIEKGLKQQIKWRRHLHQYPELSFQEYQTTAFLKDIIKYMGLRIIPIKMETGLLAELKGKSPGPTIAIRTDIDALPITEQTDLPFKSKNKGCMHACGHDFHVAVVLGVASVLKNMKNDFPGQVRFIFQPAEEMPPGGARPMIANGALKNVDMILGLHVDPTIGVGKISLRDGVAMASVTDFDLIIKGKSGHAAHPHRSIDAIVIAAEIVGSLQKIVSREIDPLVPVAITFGKIEGGYARNIISDWVRLTGTARTLSTKTAKKIPRLIKRIATSICQAHGAKLEMKIIADYPVLSNHKEANKLLARNFDRFFGKKNRSVTTPVLGGEDFACYLEKTVGAMFRLGVKNKKIKADKPWHSSQFVGDERAIFYGTCLLVATVIDFLQSRKQ
ncbi:MAG: amidohydrolase [FCB group bacterium]|nr:amidohydrolase [FCB group bacterium]